MVHRCCIASCKMNVRQAESKGLSYHQFPINNIHREKWIQAITPHVEKPESFKIVQNYTRICSRHFKISEYSYDTKKRARLNSTAVPSVFQRKSTSSPLVQSTIEAIKPKIAKLKNAAMTLTNNSPSSSSLITQNSCQQNEQQVVIVKVENVPVIQDIKIERDEEYDSNLSSSSSSVLMQSTTSANDQMILNLLKDISVVVSSKLESTTNLEKRKESLENDNNDDQKLLLLHQEPSPPPQQQQPPEKGSVRKRRKWNRSAFTRSTKSKLKKDNSSGGIDDNNSDDLLTLSNYFPALSLNTNNNNNNNNNNNHINNNYNNDNDNNDTIILQSNYELEPYKNESANTNVTFKTPSTPTNCKLTSSNSSSELISSASSSCLSLNDPTQITVNLSLMSLDQDLLQSIQSVSLDSVEPNISTTTNNTNHNNNTNTTCTTDDNNGHHHHHHNDDENDHKNIHIGETDLIPIEDLVSDLLLDSETRKTLDLENPILLEDALISSASGGVNLHSSETRDDDFNKLIDNLAYDFSSSLLTTNVSLPNNNTTALNKDCPTFCDQNSINLSELPDNLLISTADILPKEEEEDSNMSGDSQIQNGHSNFNKSSDRFKNSKKSIFPRKKLVGVSKATRVKDRNSGKFSVERFKDSDKDIEYYTGFPTYQHFEDFFYSLDTYVGKLKVTDIMHGIEDMMKNCQETQEQQQQQSSPLKISQLGSETILSNDNSDSSHHESMEEQKKKILNRKKIDEVFMTLIRLKRRIPEKVLGDMFLVSQPTVSRVVRAWTLLLSKLLEPLPTTNCTSDTSSSNSIRTKTLQSSSLTKKEEFHNYFSEKGIYIPDAFRSIFKTELAIQILASAKNNPRMSSNSTSTNKKSNRNNNNNCNTSNSSINNNNNNTNSESMEIAIKSIVKNCL